MMTSAPTFFPQPYQEKGVMTRQRQRRRHYTILHEVNTLSKKTNNTLTLHSEPEGSITYAELYAKAVCFAQALIAENVNPGTPVGICLDRNFDLIAAFFGTWLAGAVVVPLEYSYDEEMRRYKLEATQLKFAITDEAKRETLQAEHITLKLIITETLENEASTTNAFQPIELTGDSHAYIEFTSGSTGNPKGVVVTHSAVSNLFNHIQKRFLTDRTLNTGSAKTDKFLINAAPTFDAFIFDLLVLLCVKESHLLPEAARRNARAVEDVLVKKSITVTVFTADFAAQLDLEKLASLELLISMGSAPGNFLETLLNKYPSLMLNNGYGVTEGGVCNTHNPVCKGSKESNLYSIGRPIENCFLYILPDKQGEFHPLDETESSSQNIRGELYIAGLCLAEGYLNDPEKTNEKFVRVEARDGTKVRLYKTGDEASFEKGLCWHLGRIESDLEIKVAGQRVNIQFVEPILNRHPKIQRATLVKCENSSYLTLVATLEKESDQQIDLESIHNHLEGELVPLQAYPEHIMIVPTLPLTANGKIDRSELTPKVNEYIKGVKEHITNEFNNSTEDKKAGASKVFSLWKKTLGIETDETHPTSPCMTFHEFGGASINYQTLVTKLNEFFNLTDYPNYRIKVTEIFSNGTCLDMYELAQDKQEQLRNEQRPTL